MQLRSRAALLSLLLAQVALAEQYETDIRITTEQDIEELHANGELSDESLETLLDLFRNGVDLSTASREEIYALPGITYEQADAVLVYRTNAGAVQDPADLVAAGILTADNLDQIAPFLVVGEREPVGTGLGGPVRGRVRLLSAYSVGDPLVPPGFLQIRGRGPHDLHGGVVGAFTRRRLSGVTADPDRAGALAARAPRPSFEVPKYFLHWKGDQAKAIAGHFRIGFGQRLTLDNTSRTNPDGFYPDDLIRAPTDLSSFCQQSGGGSVVPCTPEQEALYVTPDFGWSEGFRGLAGRLEHIPLGAATLQLTAFGSFQSKSIFQYDFYDTSRCADPTRSTPVCASPPVNVIDGGGARFVFQTLPALHDELAYGGHAALYLGGVKVGLTGFHAINFWRTGQALPLDFRPSARQPYGGPYGAAGLDFAWPVGIFSLYGEVARSFDREPGGGGGFAALQRTTATFGRQEVELVLRYYDREYANPLSRPISAADEFEGNRARNETGVRAKYTGRFDTFALRSQVDLYALPQEAAVGTAGFTTLDTYVRADYSALGWLKPSLWLYYRNKNLVVNGPGQCFDATFQTDPQGRSIPCNGEQYRVQGRLEFRPFKELSIAAQYQHEWLTDRAYPTALRQDRAAWLIASYRPTPQLGLRLRSKYHADDLFDDGTGSERSLWTYAAVSYRVQKTWAVQVRYDNFAWLDRRRATVARRPSPEHRVRLELEASF